MKHSEWNRLDLKLAELIADRQLRREHPEEWLQQVVDLRELLDEGIDELANSLISQGKGGIA